MSTREEKEAAANRLRHIMKVRRITKNQLAIRAKIEASSISRILSENRDFKVSTAIKIANGLNVSLDYLLLGAESEISPSKESRLKRLSAQIENILWEN